MSNQWRPDICPITGRAFFMWIEHPTLGNVPTYGGPLDSYTIPTKDSDGEFSCERYDHDFGGWVESECLGLYLIDDKEQCRVYELEERIAELETNLAALAAENAELNKFIVQSCYVFNGEQDEISDAYICATDGGMPQTLATDAFLADVRAVAFDELRAAFVRHVKVAGLDEADTVTLKEVTEALLHCAEQIRAPE
ncbi:TPA: hypothetical protein KL329_002908 [Escherichia coli]|uniref:Ead/Ea22-like family protein n=1 Tax=Escherichia coli TaxID=562 RepID=A0AAF0HPS9_ECOLX|nr:hypothetical protein [Escherichia coli]EFE8029688.1 hypothetical protein [Escherichia coli]MDM4864277.1 hypothetical protein [Escherichia coli]WHF95538.1 hypothetical protein QDX09_13775 [Escherichia coli]WHI03997.1 hypothetical protein QDW62_11050 [Escherichia coli]HAW0922989.1 hypothetical protein [Escherichia coli]